MDAPVRGIDGPAVQRDVNDARLHLGRDRGVWTRTRSVLAQSIDAAVQETLTSQRHLAPVEPDLHCEALILSAIRGEQDHACPLLQPSLHSPGLGKHTKLPLGRLVQFDRHGDPHRSSLGDWGVPAQIL